MEIELLLKEKSLLRASYIKLIRKKDFAKIIIKRDHIKLINLQFGDISKKKLIIKVSFKGIKNFKNKYIFKVSDILIKTGEIILLGTLNDPLHIYNQGYIENFKLLTDKKEKIKWYELDDKQKYYYLRGCCLLSGVREDIDNINSTIVINLSKVKMDLDVYYEIGKSFFNSYGYFGTEFNSFRDCLSSIIHGSMKKREKMPILKIKGYGNFLEYFSNNILFNDFYELFEGCGFEIINAK